MSNSDDPGDRSRTKKAVAADRRGRASNVAGDAAGDDEPPSTRFAPPAGVERDRAGRLPKGPGR